VIYTESSKIRFLFSSTRFPKIMCLEVQSALFGEVSTLLALLSLLALVGVAFWRRGRLLDPAAREPSLAAENRRLLQQLQGLQQDSEKIAEERYKAGMQVAEAEVRRKNRELHLLNSIAVTFNQSFNLEEILQLSLLLIIDLFSTDTAAVYELQESTGALHRKAGYGHRSSWVRETESFVLPPDFLQFVQQERLEIITHHDLPRMPEIVRKYVEMEGYQSWLWVMLWRNDKVLGLLGTSSRSQREFSQPETRLVLAVGGQLATTIEKIQLYEETRKAYDDLRFAQEQLLQSEKMSAVGQMISGVAHELNNPLTAILGYAQLLENEEVQPQVREYLHKLQKQAYRTQKIVQNLLSFSREHKPQRAHVDICNVIEDTIALRDFELKANEIVVEKDFADGLPLVVADPHQLQQVYLNIINNAADAMLDSGRGGVLRIGIFADGHHVVTEFHDSGPGITEPKRVFDPFYTTKNVGKGTGLGLSICYGIIKEHGGVIAAENHSQGGALISIRLPAAGDKPMTEGERIVARREPKLSGSVLLVEAEQPTLDFEREVLSAAGLKVVALSSGARAVELLGHDSFDVVLLDSKIAGPVSCEEVIQWIHQSRPDLEDKTVLMPATSPEAEGNVSPGSGKGLFLVKPFEVTDLLGVVRRVLRDTRPSYGDREVK
jgi:signal transduction histidine kinase/CheY-like chemotaxis protein